MGRPKGSKNKTALIQPKPQGPNAAPQDPKADDKAEEPKGPGGPACPRCGVDESSLRKSAALRGIYPAHIERRFRTCKGCGYWFLI